MTTTPPVLTPPRAHPVPSEPGYITTLSLGGSDYYVRAYIESADGTRTYLPQNCDPQAFEKVRSLAWGLFNAHEELRRSRNEAPYTIKHVDATGLVKTDNTVISHDFAIQPVSNLVANTMADSLTRDGQPQAATTIKTLDVWNRIETLIRGEMGRPNPNPVRIDTPPQPQQTNPPNIPPQPQPPSLPLNPPNPLPDPVLPQPPEVIPPQRPVHDGPILSTDLDIRTIDFAQPNWYDQIPPRQQLRILSDITSYRCPVGGVYERVCELFKERARNTPSSWITLMDLERMRLQPLCRNLPSQISPPIRRQANAIIESRIEEQQARIQEFMAQEFDRKEILFQCIREQAEAEGVVIEESDSEWAQNHALDNTHRFVQGLARWIDND